MKKTCRWIFSAVIFLILGIALFLPISETLRKKTAEETDMVHSFYAIEEDTLDVLFLGSSHAYYGIQPNELWKEYGITSYSMASPEQTAATSYFLLKEAFAYQKPKVVVLESYYLWYNGLYNSESRLRQAFDGMRLGANKIEMIQTMLEGSGIKNKLTYAIPFLKYHSRWQELEDYDFHTKAYLKGARIDFTTAEVEDPGIPKKAAAVPELSLEYLDKMIALCEENDAEFVVTAIPFGIETNKKRYKRRQGLNLTLEGILEEKGIPFLFYQRDYGDVIDFSTDFRDKTHLNTAGAQKLTAHLGGWLAEQYGLSGHKGEAEYASWDEDLRLYEEDLWEARENPVDTADEVK